MTTYKIQKHRTERFSTLC